MRLDLEDYDFEIQHIKGSDNVGTDALSRIVTSEDLKNKTILMVHTRAMNKKQNEIDDQCDVSSKEKTDHLLVYETERIEETRKLKKMKISAHDNMISIDILSHNWKKPVVRLEKDIIHENESQTLEFALSEMNEILKNDKIAMSTNSEIFKNIHYNISNG